MKKIALVALFLTSFFYKAEAQVKMGNNTSTINSGALLELESTNKGLLIPRVTLISETNISPFSSTPTNSMLVYNDGNNMTKGFYYWLDGKWTIIAFKNSVTSGGSSSSGGGTSAFEYNNSNTSQGVILSNSSNSSTGQYSFVSGFSNTSSGSSSASFGQSNSNSGLYAITGGYKNIASATASIAFGQSDTASGAASFAAGLGNKSSNTSSVALGQNNQSTGQYSFAVGNNNKSSATATISMGEGNISNTDYAISLGKGNTASNTNAFASGSQNTASGTSSTSMGQGNTSSGSYSFTGGYSNKATGTASIAMGQGAEAVHSNSFVFADGPGTALKSTNSNQFSSTFNNGYRFLTSTYGGAILTSNEFSPTNTYTTLGTSSNKWSAVYATNGTIQTSDKRLKKNIEDMKYGLKEVMNMRPITYNWISGGTENKIGFVAQDLQKIIPEVVNVGNDADKTLAVNYAELVSVLTKAIQEQQAMINELKIEVSALKNNSNNSTAKK